MRPFSITAPEEIAKEYGGNKKKIQQAAAQGLIDPTSAVLAGMFVDRMRNAAAQEQAQQPTVAEQVMNPQPQMPPQGMAAMPQAQQMPQQMPQQAQMGRPQAPMPQPQGMAMGGGLDSIDYVEGDYAEGGIVSFNQGGGTYPAQIAALTQLLNDPRTSASDREKAKLKLNEVSMKAKLEQQTLASQDLVNRESAPLYQPAGDTGQVVRPMPEQVNFADIEVSDAGIPAPTMSANQSPDVGMETFADGMVSRPDQGQRIDTGTLTEAEARRIEGTSFLDRAIDGTKNFFDRANRESGIGQIMAQNKALADANVVPDAYTGATVAADPLLSSVEKGKEVAGLTGSRVRDTSGRFGLKDIARYVMGTGEDVYGQADPYAGLVTQESGVDAGQVQDVQTGFQGRLPVEDTTAATAQTANQFVEQPEDQAVFGDRAATTQAAPETVSLDDVVSQIKATEDTSKTLAGTKDAIDTQSAMLGQVKAEKDSLAKIQELLKPAEKGEFRKEMEALVRDREGRLKEAKNEAFSMALLQAGLGMLGQGGGQTALQALGKSALPAVQDAAKSLKDAKKEDRELLQLGLAMEQMDEKQKAEVNKVLAQQVGENERARLLRGTQLQIAKLNNTRAIDVAKINAESASRSMNIAAMESAAGRITSELATTRQLANESLMINKPYLENSKRLLEAQEDLASNPDDKDLQQKVADLESKGQEIRAKALRDGGFTQSISELETIRDRLNSRLTSGITGSTAASTQATPLPSNPTAANLKVGTVYQTPRGIGRWNGKSFDVVQ